MARRVRKLKRFAACNGKHRREAVQPTAAAAMLQRNAIGATHRRYGRAPPGVRPLAHRQAAFRISAACSKRVQHCNVAATTRHLPTWRGAPPLALWISSHQIRRIFSKRTPPHCCLLRIALPCSFLIFTNPCAPRDSRLQRSGTISPPPPPLHTRHGPRRGFSMALCRARHSLRLGCHPNSPLSPPSIAPLP